MGLGAPAGTPRPIIDRIAAEVQKLVALPDTPKKLEAQGFDPYFNGPEQTADIIKRDIGRFAKIIKAAGIQVQ